MDIQSTDFIAVQLLKAYFDKRDLPKDAAITARPVPHVITVDAEAAKAVDASGPAR